MFFVLNPDTLGTFFQQDLAAIEYGNNGANGRVQPLLMQKNEGEIFC